VGLDMRCLGQKAKKVAKAKGDPFGMTTKESKGKSDPVGMTTEK